MQQFGANCCIKRQTEIESYSVNNLWDTEG